MKGAPLWAFVIGLWSVHATGFADPADASAASASNVTAQIDFILDNPLPESDYAQSKRCVYPNAYRSIEILDGRHLLFWGDRGVVWLNQLRFECPGLKRDAVLIFDMRDRSLCDMDNFDGAPRAGGVAASFAAHCMLGHFESISEDQAETLRIALSRNAQSPAPKPKAPHGQ